MDCNCDVMAHNRYLSIKTHSLKGRNNFDTVLYTLFQWLTCTPKGSARDLSVNVCLLTWKCSPCPSTFFFYNLTIKLAISLYHLWLIALCSDYIYGTLNSFPLNYIKYTSLAQKASFRRLHHWSPTKITFKNTKACHTRSLTGIPLRHSLNINMSAFIYKQMN